MRIVRFACGTDPQRQDPQRQTHKTMSDSKKRYYRKNVGLFNLLNKMKLWPSRSGRLHGIKSIDNRGEHAIIVTHCNKNIIVRDSRNSRAARWLRNKWVDKPCEKCKVPQWKIEKYSQTFFSQYGSDLSHQVNEE